ncbi:MAG: aldehyde ferredoxin oxidoreductase C-terminal domain-containing protein [Candidatus Bathyarchaeia archaeon]
MLLLGGPDVQWKPKIDDENPPRFWEPLPSGPYKGKTADRNRFEKDRQEYYKMVGWNENAYQSQRLCENSD